MSLSCFTDEKTEPWRDEDDLSHQACEEPGAGPGLPDWVYAPDATSPLFSTRQVTEAEGAALAGRFGCLFFEVSACLDYEHVQHVFHEAVREARRELEKNSLARPLFISEERALPHQAALTARHGLASCTFNTLSTVSLKEMPTVAQAKLVTVKSSRAQSKRKAPTLTLLKGFKIF